MLQPFSRSAETLKLKEFSVGERIKWLAVFCSCSLLSCSSSSRALARICTEYRALAVDVVGEGAERPDTGEVTVPAGSCRSTIARLTRPGCVRRRYAIVTMMWRGSRGRTSITTGLLFLPHLQCASSRRVSAVGSSWLPCPRLPSRVAHRFLRSPTRWTHSMVAIVPNLQSFFSKIIIVSFDGHCRA